MPQVVGERTREPSGKGNRDLQQGRCGTCYDHGSPLGHQQSLHEVAHLPLPQGQHSGVLRVTLRATVPAEVVVSAVLVALAVGVVPLAVVGH